MPETKRDEGQRAHRVGWFPRAKYQDLVFYVESDQGMNRQLFEMPDTPENRALMTQLAAPAPQPQDTHKLIETVREATKAIRDCTAEAASRACAKIAINSLAKLESAILRDEED